MVYWLIGSGRIGVDAGEKERCGYIDGCVAAAFPFTSDEVSKCWIVRMHIDTYHRSCSFGHKIHDILDDTPRELPWDSHTFF